MKKVISLTPPTSKHSIRSRTDQLDSSFVEIPLDTLTVKVESLKISENESQNFTIKIMFHDQLIICTKITGVNSRTTSHKFSKILAMGTFTYDPSDYEKMCLFADGPLRVTIYPDENVVSKDNIVDHSSVTDFSEASGSPEISTIKCCNIDILHIFLGDKANETFSFSKRMQPLIEPSALQKQSWDCLPLLKLEIKVDRNMENYLHHQVLKSPNLFQVTLVGAYNMMQPFCKHPTYTAASKAIFNENNTGLITFNQGFKPSKHHIHTSFYPKWESLRIDQTFGEGDKKLDFKLNDVKNPDHIDLEYYINKSSHSNTVLWGSFHRTLMLEGSIKKWFSEHILNFNWPLEIHIHGEGGGYSFMGLINLCSLLYPGETKVMAAVPLEWINAIRMQQACNTQPLLPPYEFNEHGLVHTTHKSRFSVSSMNRNANSSIYKTGADQNNAFVIVEVKLSKPLTEIVIPPRIRQLDLKKMLQDIEKAKSEERFCTGLGQRTTDWQATVRMATSALRKIPYYGSTEINAFTRQLGETRTRVEIMTSFWQEAAIYVNNKFVLKQYLHSEEIFDELVMMAHVCLMKIAYETLLTVEERNEDEIGLKAARQSRQMQDIDHAVELYMRFVVKRPNDGNSWRELSTCLKDVDFNWAKVCLNKSVVLNIRHPLTLVSKGGMVFEENPDAAEIFFVALISFYPFWTTAWIIASAYFYDRQQYLMSENIFNIVMESRRDGETEELGYARSWERELGDWWDITPLLPGSNLFYDAADLLLRLRCISLAEVCVARALTTAGETPAYFHLLALCCRLRGRYQDALCHLNIALDKFGEIQYLRSLEAECYFQLNDTTASLQSYEKAGCTGSSPYSVLMALPAFKDSQRVRPLLLDLTRRSPSAYTWMALADDWMMKAEVEVKHGNKMKMELDAASVNAAVACAEQALKRDRLAATAWAFLATVVKPSARRYFCLKMAALCGHKLNKNCLERDTESTQSLCYRLGKPIAKCRCYQFEDKYP